MKHLLVASLITLLAFGTACGQASEPEPAPSDGIQVHGHWTVTVTNPDGTVDAVHEFENALSGTNGHNGAQALGILLAGETQIREYAIQLLSSMTDAVDCEEPGSTSTGSQFGKWIPARAIRDMTVEGTPVTIVGSCTVQASQPSAITEVSTMIYFNSSIDYMNPYNPINSRNHLGFTNESNLSISVANAQVATFNVVITFS